MHGGKAILSLSILSSFKSFMYISTKKSTRGSANHAWNSFLFWLKPFMGFLVKSFWVIIYLLTY